MRLQRQRRAAMLQCLKVGEAAVVGKQSRVGSLFEERLLESQVPSPRDDFLNRSVRVLFLPESVVVGGDDRGIVAIEDTHNICA